MRAAKRRSSPFWDRATSLGKVAWPVSPFEWGPLQPLRPSTMLVIEKREMFKALHEQHGLSDKFITFMLARNIRVEEDLIDQLFNSSEKRLARTLLLLARYGKDD